ncbi:RNA polymerase subunit sigma [Nonomuraea deserti]|uniref:RNA polymerase subunit sigma n=1 Tax=Nonomuraea deserti TaxID=1848322 RepID=A0A4R4UAN3_9ACTN|nr:RNA polymerase subunit sigma [Nonomuraea deserti]TDC88200.1 RNA polymerase subunit sigma [Nonomuraea deserti]
MTETDAGSLAEMLDERRHLLEITLWMFGSAGTAEWIVEETYRRWYALDDGERATVAAPRAWLTRVAGGICLDLLAATPPDSHPVTSLTATPPAPHTSPAPTATPPGPRPATPSTAMPSARISASPASEQPVSLPDLVAGLARLHPGRTRFDRHDRVARRFVAACVSGDVAALRAVLAPDVMAVSDGGGKVRAALRPAHGADTVARLVTELLTGRSGTDSALTGRSGTDPAAESVNGRTGLVLRQAGQAVAVISVSVAGNEVTAVWIVLNPDKLRSWHRPRPAR